MNELSSSNLNTIQSLGFELVHALERPSVLGQVAIIAMAIAIACFMIVIRLQEVEALQSVKVMTAASPVTMKVG